MYKKVWCMWEAIFEKTGELKTITFCDVHKLGKLKMNPDKKLIHYYTSSIEKNYKPWHRTDVSTVNPHA